MSTLTSFGESLCDFADHRCGVTCDKHAKIRTFMHYTDPQWDQEITVFGAESKGLFYNYNDRLFSDEWTKGCKSADKLGLKRDTAAWFEHALTVFHNAKSLDLRHIILGVNRSSGYHYLVFGYKYKV